MKINTLLLKKVHDLDAVLDNLASLRAEVLKVVKQKKKLEKQIIKRFKRSSVCSVESVGRIYSLARDRKKQKSEKALDFLIQNLENKNQNTDKLEELKSQLVCNKRKVTTLNVTKKFVYINEA